MANVFLLPSRGEGFPISLIEAMRGQCIPIISDAKHGALDLIKNGVNGFIVKQGSSEDLYKRLVYIIKNHGSLADIYQASYDTYNAYLTEKLWKNNMQAILESANDHKSRKVFYPHDKLLEWGRIKMKMAEIQYWLTLRLYKHPLMMIKYRYYKYVYRFMV